MINVVFSPGSYGHYFSSCLHSYSDLTKENDLIEFGVYGDSHAFKKNKIFPTHDAISNTKIDKIIYLNPSLTNQLDYIDNQFEKIFKCNLTEYLDSLSFNKNILNIWELREDMSFWLGDLMNNSYYSFVKKINSESFIVNVNSFFEDFLTIFDQTLTELSLKKTVTNDIILKRHNDFLKLQKNHNKQIRVKSWVHNIINNVDSVSPCDTIFDEAYAQNQLRNSGYEIKCYNLNTFPKNSAEFRKLLV